MSVRRCPSVVALAGPNGAGKSTAGPELLKNTLGVMEFVNADVIAQGLSAFAPERTAIQAGRVMIRRLEDLARRRASFAFETTLAGRSYVRWIGRLVQDGYEFHILFLWLPSAQYAVRRVADRARLGGHDVPPATVRRRYGAGLRNFFRAYRRLAATWTLYDNSGVVPRLVASGRGAAITTMADEGTWRRIAEEAGNGA